MAARRRARKPARKPVKSPRAGTNGTIAAHAKDEIDQELAESFLESLIETAGNVVRACQKSGLPHTTAYRWREEDEAFAEAWKRAQKRGVDVLEDEARRRAFDGVEKPVYQQKELVGYVQEYSDTLMCLLLKAHRSELYRDRLDVHDDRPPTILLGGEVPPEVLARIRAAAGAGDAG